MERATAKVRMNLEGQSGNAFDLPALFTNNAKDQGWQRAEIDAVLSEARTGEYEHLLRTLVDRVEESNSDE